MALLDMPPMTVYRPFFQSTCSDGIIRFPLKRSNGSGKSGDADLGQSHSTHFFASKPMTFSISLESNARAVVVWTLPCDDRYSMAAVAVSSLGALKIRTPSESPSVQ